MADPTGKTAAKPDVSGALAAQQLAGAIGAREAANVLAFMNAWKTGVGVLGKAVPAIGAVVYSLGLLKKGVDTFRQQSIESYKLATALGVTTKGWNAYNVTIQSMSRFVPVARKELQGLSSSLATSTGFIDKGLKTTNDYVYAIGKLFPHAVKEAAQTLKQVSDTMPYVIDWIEKGTLGFTELSYILDKSGGDITRFLDQISRFRSGDLTLGGLTQITKLNTDLLNMGKLWKDMGDSAAGAFREINENYKKLPEGAKTGMMSGYAEAMGTLRGAQVKEVETLTEKFEAQLKKEAKGKPLGWMEGVRETAEKGYVYYGEGTAQLKILVMELGNAKQAQEKMNTAYDAYIEDLKKQGIYYVFLHDQFVKNKGFELEMLGETKTQIDIIREGYNLTYQSYDKILNATLSRINLLKQEEAIAREIRDDFVQQGLAAHKTLEEIEKSPGYQQKTTAIMKANLEVLKEESYVRREIWEKLFQFQLQMSKGTYTMPTELSGRVTKGPGHFPFAPLERGPRGQWGSWEGEGTEKKFKERPQTGPYEQFYRRLFGGAGAMRSPAEQIMQKQLNTQDDMLSTLHAIDNKMGGTAGGGTGTTIEEYARAVEDLVSGGAGTVPAVAGLLRERGAGGGASVVTSAGGPVTTSAGGPVTAGRRMGGKYGTTPWEGGMGGIRPPMFPGVSLSEGFERAGRVIEVTLAGGEPIDLSDEAAEKIGLAIARHAIVLKPGE